MTNSIDPKKQRYDSAVKGLINLSTTHPHLREIAYSALEVMSEYRGFYESITNYKDSK